MVTLQLTFRCLDNNCQTFQFQYADPEAYDTWLRKLIQAIIDNNSIFSNPPVSCLHACIFSGTEHIEKTGLCTSFVSS